MKMSTDSIPVAEGQCAPDRPSLCDSLGQINLLAEAVEKHLDRLGIDRSDWVRVGKVAEEGGEVVGALIKRTYGQATDADVEAELGDVILAALAAAMQLGTVPSHLIAKRWAEVSQRSETENVGLAERFVDRTVHNSDQRPPHKMSVS